MAKTTITQQAMRTLGSIGGKATVRKHGKAYMKSLVNKRWKKQRAENRKVERLKEDKEKK